METKLTPLYIKTFAEKFDFLTILFLDLKNKGVVSLGAIADCKNLQTLDLSRNMIQSLAGIENCLELKYLNLSYNRIASATALEACAKLHKLELQGNKILEFKGLPCMTTVQVLYLQEFTLDGQNPVCAQAGYQKKVYELFQGLKALDGYRKSVPMNYNMQEALPEETKDDFKYNVSHVEWYDQRELDKEDPGKGLFDETAATKKEEAQLAVLLKDFKSLLDRKKDILTY